MRGLCGTLTWNQHDDFITPEGDVENSVSSFAGKFMRGQCSLPQGTPPDPCTTYTQRKQYAETLCSVIHSPVFKVHRIESWNPFWTFSFTLTFKPGHFCRRVMMWLRGNPTSASVSQRFALATPRGRVTAMFSPPSPATALRKAPRSTGATRRSAVSFFFLRSCLIVAGCSNHVHADIDTYFNFWVVSLKCKSFKQRVVSWVK